MRHCCSVVPAAMHAVLTGEQIAACGIDEVGDELAGAMLGDAEAAGVEVLIEAALRGAANRVAGDEILGERNGRGVCCPAAFDACLVGAASFAAVEQSDA